MAKPPLCKVCGVAHWASEPHRLARRTEPLDALTIPEDGGDALADYLAQRRAAQAAYMREYRAGVRRRGPKAP